MPRENDWSMVFGVVLAYLRRERLRSTFVSVSDLTTTFLESKQLVCDSDVLSKGVPSSILVVDVGQSNDARVSSFRQKERNSDIRHRDRETSGVRRYQRPSLFEVASF